MQKLILLIDDDEDELDILNQAIQLAGIDYGCVGANGIDQAEALLQQIQPNLVLVDYNMPKVNGIACLIRLRKIDKLREVPIILYSNHISEVSREQARTQGASCLQKPGSLSELVKYLLKIANEGGVIQSFK